MQDQPTTAQHNEFESEFDADDLEPRALRLPSRRRVLTVGAVLLVIALLAILPPLINVNRYRRNIATSISRSLGRPVRVDSVALTVFPLPGFTLKHFVVGEDPAFGAEPVIFADSVRVTLRWSSLWHRRVEFSRITLDSPSVNLVHLPDGRWNLESILIQAARMPAAPTAQRDRGPAPRFPYISASSARVNLKMGTEKMPISLTDADFSLWLPEPLHWHLRLEGHPARTDTAATDTGIVRLDGTLGKAGTLADVPVDLTAAWSAAPLGAVSTVLMGRDAHLRGELTLTAAIAGTVGRNTLSTRIQLAHFRRADFVPDQTLSLDLRCTAATALVHTLGDVQCASPPTAGVDGHTSSFVFKADVPDIFHLHSAAARVTLTAIPAATVLQVVHAASPRISPALTAGGTIDADVSCCAASLPASYWKPFAPPPPGPNGSVFLNRIQLALPGTPAFLDGVSITGNLETTLSSELMQLTLPIALGAPKPAQMLFAITRQGYTMDLIGPALPSRLAVLAQAIPPFGEGLPPDVLPASPRTNLPLIPSAPVPPEQPIDLGITATHPWFGPQTWTRDEATPPPTHHRPRSGRHHGTN